MTTDPTSKEKTLSLESIGGKTVDFRIDSDGELAVVISLDNTEEDFILSVAALSRLRSWLSGDSSAVETFGDGVPK